MVQFESPADRRQGCCRNKNSAEVSNEKMVNNALGQAPKKFVLQFIRSNPNM